MGWWRREWWKDSCITRYIHYTHILPSHMSPIIAHVTLSFPWRSLAPSHPPSHLTDTLHMCCARWTETKEGVGGVEGVMDSGGDRIGGQYEIGADAYDDVQAALVALERKAVEQHSELIAAIRNLSEIIDGRRRAVMQGQREARPLEAFDFHMFRGHKYVLQFSDGSGKRAPRSNRHFFHMVRGL